MLTVIFVHCNAPVIASNPKKPGAINTISVKLVKLSDPTSQS